MIRNNALSKNKQELYQTHDTSHQYSWKPQHQYQVQSEEITAEFNVMGKQAHRLF